MNNVFDFPNNLPLIPAAPPSHHDGGVSASSATSAVAVAVAKRRRKKRSKPPENGVVSAETTTTTDVARACSECGKKFWSWKALFGHMRCHPERHWRGIKPPPNQHHHHRRPASPVTNDNLVDHEIATCLLLLANNGSSAGNDNATPEMTTTTTAVDHIRQDHITSYDVSFECSSCKKVFRSHQALGGHRASHKNVKGCFAMTRSSGAGGGGTGTFGDEAIGSCCGNSIGLDFDLNLPASVMEDATTYCLVSSSPGLALDLRLGL